MGSSRTICRSRDTSRERVLRPRDWKEAERMILTAAMGKARAVILRAGTPMAAACAPAWKQYRSRGEAARHSRTAPPSPIPTARARLNRMDRVIRPGDLAP